MSDFNYSVVLRDLSEEYYSQRISKQEYRDRRTQLLNKIDAEYNGRKFEQPETDGDTRVMDDSFFMKTVAFFKNKNVDG
jgi:hypothetical protein